MNRILPVIVALLWCLPTHGAEPQRNVLVSSTDLPQGHPFLNLTPDQIKAEMRRSHKDTVVIQLEAYSEPESIKLIAKFSHDLFQALVEEGFSEEQALEIVKSIGLPGRR